MKTTTSNNWGGPRIAGPGKKIGRPSEIKDARKITVYLDPATLTLLESIHPVRSKAIRILAAQYKKARS